MVTVLSFRSSNVHHPARLPENGNNSHPQIELPPHARAMEYTLRCNALKCRMQLNDHAVVTTCSHVFCVDCANRLHLSNPPGGQRPICPACDAELTNPDDAVITNLNPTEDYKTSVLSGLSPNVIMECSGRALSFWAYQTTQEIVYQEFLAKCLTEKYTVLNSQINKIIHEANAEISDLRAKMQNMIIDEDHLRRKNEEITQAFRDKSRKYSQIQELYDKLKRRAMLGHVQNAASDAVDHTLQASAASSRFVGPAIHTSHRKQRSGPHSDYNINGLSQPRFSTGDSISSVPPLVAMGSFNGVWNRSSHQEDQNQIDSTQTPSSHRQRLASGGISTTNMGGTQSFRTASAPLFQQRRTPTRQPPTRLSPIGAGSNAFAGYGMSAGVKVSHPPNTVQSNTAGFRETIRSRVAQRPGQSAYVRSRALASGPESEGVAFGQNTAYH